MAFVKDHRIFYYSFLTTVVIYGLTIILNQNKTVFFAWATLNLRKFYYVLEENRLNCRQYFIIMKAYSYDV